MYKQHSIVNTSNVSPVSQSVFSVEWAFFRQTHPFSLLIKDFLHYELRNKYYNTVYTQYWAFTFKKCQGTTPKGTTSIVPLSEIPIKGEFINLIPVSSLVCIQHSAIFIRITSELKEIKQAKEVKHTSAMLHVYCSQQFALKMCQNNYLSTRRFSYTSN